MTLGMRLRTAAVLAALGIALIFAACGGDGGIDVVPDEERQERQDILDRESDGDAGLGDENSGDARDDTLDQELDGDRRSSDDAGDTQDDALDSELDPNARRAVEAEDVSEVVTIESLGISIAVSSLPCFADEGLVRSVDGGIGCAAAATLASFVNCDDGSRPVLDLMDLTDNLSAIPLTLCVPLEDTADDVFGELEIDD